jgi:DNA-binding beta-propeller fold protein YncE
MMILAAAAGAAAAAGMTDLGVAVPEPGPWRFTALAADASGGVYAFEGDTLYRLEGGGFQPAVANVAAQVWPGQDMTIDPSGFAVTPSGTAAYVATGMSGRLVEIDIDTASPQFGAARELTGAAMPSGSNYGVAVDPVAGGVYLTDSYSADLWAVDTAGAGSLTQVRSFPGGLYGSGIGFSPAGDLIVPVAKGYAAWPTDDGYPVDLWRFGRDVFEGLAGGSVPPDAGDCFAAALTVSGSGFTAVDADGNTYLQAADGIYRVDPSGGLSVLVGDTSLNAFDLVGVGFMGLAFDASANRLLFAQRTAADVPWMLHEVVLPEPATLGLVGAGLVLALARRRRGSVRR